MQSDNENDSNITLNSTTCGQQVVTADGLGTISTDVVTTPSVENDLGQRLIFMQQHFQRQQDELLMQFQQKYAQLTLQHAQDSQRLVENFLFRSHMEADGDENDDYEDDNDDDHHQQSGGLLASGLDLSISPSLTGRRRSTISNVDRPPFIADSRHPSSSSTAVSQRTKQRLKTMLHNKRCRKDAENIPGFQSPGSVSSLIGNTLFEPYPKIDHIISGHDYRHIHDHATDLRKATSEPNLKMKGVQALRAKLMMQRQQLTGLSADRRRRRLTTSVDQSSSTSGGDVASMAAAGGSNSLIGHHHQQPSQVSAMSLPNVFNFGRSTYQPTTHDQQTLTTACPTTLDLMDHVIRTNAMLGLGQQVNTLQRFNQGVAFNNAAVLLHAQIRDLALRRKSLVREETEDDVKREVLDSLSVAETESLLRCLDQPRTSDMTSISTSSSLTPTGTGTGLVYDSSMCKHQCTCLDHGRHVEHPGRVKSIWARLQETGLADQCRKFSGRKASFDLLRLCHSASYCTFFGISPTACLKTDSEELPLKSFVQLSCGGMGVDSDTYFNDATTPTAARMAVGCAVDLCLAVADGRLSNGFAIVRPPGHHAEPRQAFGFCFFNNVGVAVKALHLNGAMGRRVLVLDWDVHHGNGTQLLFEEDPKTLYLSLHRHDHGNFFPGTGAVDEAGKGAGRGFTVNVAWCGEAMGDAEYLAAWRCVVKPVLDQFQPQFIVVSCGFDAAEGHANSLGGYKVSSYMFGWMTQQLVRNYADGKVVLVLEGGYNLPVISEASEYCCRALLGRLEGHVMPPASFVASCRRLPNADCLSTLQRVVDVHAQFWPRIDFQSAAISHDDALALG